MSYKQTPEKKIALIILDGFGHSRRKKHNAVAHASMPCWKKLWKTYPHALLEASGQHVGLPDQQMGNSEVGHLTLGAGRIVDQELSRIDKAIENKTFFNNPALSQALDKTCENQTAVHILGLLSDGGVHSHENHIHAMIAFAVQKKCSKIYLHAFLDGRDTPPESAAESLKKIRRFPEVRTASLIGRYYAMDRDNRAERTQRAFEALTASRADFFADSAEQALSEAYARGETDEFIKPILIHINSDHYSKNKNKNKNKNSQKFVKILPQDFIIFMNFRADRARQLSYAFIQNGFYNFVSLTCYAQDLSAYAAFAPQRLKNTLTEYLSSLKLKQFHAAETEKYAHVTFFFNGGVEKPYDGETRLLIPSPKVSTYDLKPEMSAWELTYGIINALNSHEYDFIVCNYANPDMLGHTGNYAQTVKSLDIIDQCLEKIIRHIQENHPDTEIIITADHGNAECMYDEKTQQAHTAHTTEPVPFVYIGREAKIAAVNADEKFSLSEVAPTILYLMGLEIPSEMTGKIMLALSVKKNKL